METMSIQSTDQGAYVDVLQFRRHVNSFSVVFRKDQIHGHQVTCRAGVEEGKDWTPDTGSRGPRDLTRPCSFYLLEVYSVWP